MPTTTTFSIYVDTVPVPPRPLFRHSRSASEYDDGLAKSARTASLAEASSTVMGSTDDQFTYSSMARVRNTFVELLPGRDPSLEGFFKERECHSCPASRGHSFEEEVPLSHERISSRTTCGSTVASTPPQFSDTEDVTEVTPRLSDEGPCAARCMPASRGFQRTMSEYRSGLRTLPTHPVTATTYGDAMSQRHALPPGPLNTMPPHNSSCSSAGYPQALADADMYNRICQEVPYVGYDTGYNAGYENGYVGNYLIGSDGYSNYAIRSDQVDMVNGSDMSGFSPTSEFLQHGCQPGMMQQQHLHVDVGGQPQVLQLSAAIHQHLPPPPAPPAPTDVPGQPMPAPPSSAPYDTDDSDDDFENHGIGIGNETSVPTRGSANHGIGRCKPCAFVHTKGCGNGFECPFCHLCAPGEKKKRRKDKLEARRAMRDIRQVFSFGGGGPDFMRMRRGSGQVRD